MTKAQDKAAQVLANKRIAFEKKVGQLTGHVWGRILTVAMKESFDAGKTAEEFAVEIASREPVGMALHPLKTVAVVHAESEARKVVEKVRADLSANGWNINAVAPNWRSGQHSYNDYHAMSGKRRLYSELTQTASDWNRFSGEPERVDMDAEGIERFVLLSGKDAAFQYDMFIVKLVHKVGEVQSAKIVGDHIWASSILTVVTENGSVENWKTQQIINFSKFGRPFYQWPSRKEMMRDEMKRAGGLHRRPKARRNEIKRPSYTPRRVGFGCKNIRFEPTGSKTLA